jgi:pimeloyl-ACP methyl ester carboxylesterase
MTTRAQDETTMTRVRSRDGTEIAYRVTGEGPPLVLVHGTTADHTRWRPLLPYLEPHATVHAVDRRGRGASGDGEAYDVAREFEDVAAVVDAVAERSGAPVALLGHSYGGLCALGAAGLTANLRALVLYEPALAGAGDDLPPGVVERIEARLASGDPEGALELMMREVVRMPDAEVALIRAQPSWAGRVAAAHTIPRELRTVAGDVFAAVRLQAIAAPALLIAGGDSPAYFRRDIDAVAGALADARIAVIDGQQHVADVLDPQTFAEHVLGFLASRGASVGSWANRAV